ncbi:uncharacterized protein A4U43_C08F26180 [Asparagus officinalis]|nr:uncharacterized protein A4U43_C08F26180 [Asparagus officinalis]
MSRLSQQFIEEYLLMRFFQERKEPIPLDDKEEQVNYGHDDTDAYLTELDDIDDESDFETMGEVMPTSFPLSGHFEPVANFEGIFVGVEREGPQSPKPCSDEGPSKAATTLDEPEISSTSVEVVPVDVPMTIAMVARTMISSKVSNILVILALHLMSGNEQI